MNTSLPVNTASDTDPIPSRSDRLAMAVIVILGSSYMLWLYQDMWFFGDEWNFIVNRRDLWARGEYAEMLFRPHTDHWSTVPVIIYAALLRTFQLHSYIPFLTALLLCHGLTSLSLHELLCRMRLGRFASLGGATLFTLLGAGAENLSWAFQIGFIGSVGLGIAQLLAVTSRQQKTRLWVAPILGVINMMTSGVAAPMLVAVATVLVLQKRYKELPANVGIQFLLYGLWYLTYGHKVPPADYRPGLYTNYVENGIFSSLEAVTRLRSSGPILLILLVIAAAIWWPKRSENSLAIGCLVAGNAMFFIFALRRASLGVEQAATSRYIYAAAAMFIGPLLVMVSSHLRDKRVAKVATGLCLSIAIAGNASGLNSWRVQRLIDVNHTRDNILAVADLPTLSQLDKGLAADPRFSPDLLLGNLAPLVSSGYLPHPNSAPSQFSVDKEADVAIRVATIDDAPGAVLNNGANGLADGCLLLDGVDGVDLDAAIEQVGVVSILGSGGSIRLQFSFAGFTSPPVEHSAEPNTPVRIRVATNRGRLLIDVSPGSAKICGLAG